MKTPLVLLSLLFLATVSHSQDAPKPADPCMKLDTNNIKQMLLGNWVDIKDPTHTLVVTDDSIEETIVIGEGINKKTNLSNFNYKFTDNVFSTDAVTCYSIVEYKSGFAHHTDYAINSIDSHYLMLGASGKMTFKKKE